MTTSGEEVDFWGPEEQTDTTATVVEDDRLTAAYADAYDGMRDLWINERGERRFAESVAAEAMALGREIIVSQREEIRRLRELLTLFPPNVKAL